ncbi:uncharacterized protein [Branchiostoma lanceolatum]|uniref:uncharacterized protein n=1 Tax=Branchiostoma lanceolatum TaxID=7740 RepID=UPI0034547F62
MAALGSHVHGLTLPFATTFDTSQMRPELSWLHEPQDFMLRADGTNGIRVTPKEKSDFWRKTYYVPELIADNGHLLYTPVTDPDCVMETMFEVSAVNQFDQAGLMVRYDHEHWLKTGLEYVDGHFRLSCVVTNVYSDWSTQDWPSGRLSIRVYRQGNSYVVENKAHDEDRWDFIRILHLEPPAPTSDPQVAMMGPMVCAPTARGGSALFHKFNVRHSDGYLQYHHN